MRVLRSCAAAAALLAAGCGPVLFAELEIPSVRVTPPPEPFPAVLVPPATVVELSHAFSYDLGADVSVLTDPSVTSELRLTSVAIELVGGGVADLGAIRSVAVDVVAPPGTSLPDIRVAAYQRSAADPNPTTLTMAGYSNVNLAPYLADGVLAISAQLAYDATTPAFTANVTGDFYVKARLDYGGAAR